MGTQLVASDATKIVRGEEGGREEGRGGAEGCNDLGEGCNELRCHALDNNNMFIYTT